MGSVVKFRDEVKELERRLGSDVGKIGGRNPVTMELIGRE